MIIVITDAKSLTKTVEDIRGQAVNTSEIAKFYSELFSKHIESIPASTIIWKVIKTTGDGLLITAAPKPGEDERFFRDWLGIMFKIYEGFQHPQIRIAAHYCDETNLIVELKLTRTAQKNGYVQNLKEFSSNLRQDIFGPEVNLAFRIAQMVSEKVFILTDQLIRKIISPDKLVKVEAKEEFQMNGLVFGPPVPITSLKGITHVGFSTNVNNATHPIWVWEVTRQN